MTTTKKENKKKSKGHVAFVGNWEYYIQKGHVYRAPLHNAFDIDGYRHGRWEGPEWMAQSLINEMIEATKKGSL